MKIRNAVIPLAVVVGFIGLNTSGAQSNDVPIWQFSVKFVCGQAQGEGDNGAVHSLGNGGYGLDEDRDPVVPGVYETAINLHNPGPGTVAGANVAPNTPSTDSDFSRGFRKKALVLYPPFREDDKGGAAAPAGAEQPPPPDQLDEFEQAQPPGFWVRPDSLGRDWGLEIDCRDIRAVLLGGRCDVKMGAAVSVSDPCEGVYPDSRAWAPLIKGYIVIEERSKLPLDVTALYSGYIHSGSTNGDTCDAVCAVTSQGQPAGFSEEIETITPKKIDTDDDNDDD